VAFAPRDLPDAVICPAWPATFTTAGVPRPGIPVEEVPMTVPRFDWYLQHLHEQVITTAVSASPRSCTGVATGSARDGAEPDLREGVSDLLGPAAAVADRTRSHCGKG
jgi:hypothetical protein